MVAGEFPVVLVAGGLSDVVVADGRFIVAGAVTADEGVDFGSCEVDVGSSE